MVEDTLSGRGFTRLIRLVGQTIHRSDFATGLDVDTCFYELLLETGMLPAEADKTFDIWQRISGTEEAARAQTTSFERARLFGILYVVMGVKYGSREFTDYMNELRDELL